MLRNVHYEFVHAGTDVTEAFQVRKRLPFFGSIWICSTSMFCIFQGLNSMLDFVKIKYLGAILSNVVQKFTSQSVIIKI